MPQSEYIWSPYLKMKCVQVVGQFCHVIFNLDLLNTLCYTAVNTKQALDLKLAECRPTAIPHCPEYS